MRSTIYILLVGFIFVLSSCSRQNPVDVDGEVFTHLSGRIENWNSGKGYSAVFIYLVFSSETSPDAEQTFIMGKSSVDEFGGFHMENISALPDTLNRIYEEPGNFGLFSSYRVDFHGYTTPYITVLDSANNFKGYLIYSTQSTSVLPYINENAVVGDYTMMYQYSDRDMSLDSSSTGITGANNTTLSLTYQLSLKKGWNKIYVVTTYVSGSDRKALWTTTAPETPGMWYLCNRYFKCKMNVFK